MTAVPCRCVVLSVAILLLLLKKHKLSSEHSLCLIFQTFGPIVTESLLFEFQSLFWIQMFLHV